jgi:GxxExxY protein
LVGTELNDLTHTIIGAAIEVHRTLGPGLLESTYEHCLTIELNSQGLIVKRQVVLPVSYKGKIIEDAYRLDLLVEDTVIVELKAVEQIMPVHKAQVFTYLNLSKKPLGLLINFNVEVLTHGIKRLYNPAFRKIAGL